MDNEKFQELVLIRLEENEKFQGYVLKRLEDNEKFQASVLEQLKSLNQGQAKLEEDVKDLKLGQTKLEANQLKLDANQLKLETKIENEVVDRIRALFDDRQVHLDYFAEIRESQVRMEGKLQSLQHRSISQEFKLKEHEQELKKLGAGN
ncbi:hypothetical protein N752_29805 [Desulforamulus aquiferis]|nr:hypothetical protein [Desulforamulus aquiferis]RYD01498.1 hypothetical protein N752_29805 [Desulforamulus aquiferis]